jgi:hypothetical protein
MAAGPPTSEAIYIMVEQRQVAIPVSTAVKAYWNEQFCRKKLTDLQSKRLRTFKNIVRAAYKQGVEDGASLGKP